MPSSFLRTCAFALALTASVPAAAAAETTGGMAAFDGLRIASLRCVPSATTTCADADAVPAGAQLKVRGRSLSAVRTLTFRGRAGRRDDVTVRARHVRPTHVEAVVPAGARTGRVELRATGGARAVSETPVRVAPTSMTAAAQPATPGDQVFPIRGKHDLGQSATNDFGGGRDHKGQDLFAACGTPLAVAEGGTVRYAATQARAGNYAVITGASSGRDYVYMHMRQPALVRKGQTVAAGQPLGEVGDTGNADGCHVHFELWSAPGWYEGGRAVDPLPDLRAWDSRDGAHSH